MAAFHLKGFERFLALKESGKAARTASAAAKPRASRVRSARRAAKRA